jgi:hypothetical protein
VGQSERQSHTARKREIEIALLTIYFQEEMPPQVFLRLRTTIKSHPAH